MLFNFLLIPNLKASECVEALRKFLSSPKLFEGTEPTDANLSALRGIVDARIQQEHVAIENSLERAVSTCPSPRTDCLSAAIDQNLNPESPRNQKFLRELFGNVCLLSGAAKGLPPNPLLAKNARSSVALNLALSMGALTSGYLMESSGDPKAQIPFDVAATVIGSILIRSEVGCRNQSKNASTLESALALSWPKKFIKNYLDYLPWVPTMAGMYVGFVAAEDLIRGEDILTGDKLKEYLNKAVLSMVWDLGFNLVHVTFLDKVYFQTLPRGRELLNNFLRRKVYAGTLRGLADKKLLIVPVGEVPGYIFELGARWSIQTARQYAWLVAEKQLTRASPEKVSKLDLPELRTFLFNR